jgi:hypothetical protein
MSLCGQLIDVFRLYDEHRLAISRFALLQIGYLRSGGIGRRRS